MGQSWTGARMNYTEDEINGVLKHLADVIASRKKMVNHPNLSDSAGENSYVYSLLRKGDDAILKKLGEETAEAIMAAKDLRHAGASADPEHLIKEIADVWFHSMVLLAQFDLRPEDVLAELKKREGISGIAEKASR
jgi:phosphoribosyl-ATP pyrophosphohydrolase